MTSKISRFSAAAIAILALTAGTAAVADANVYVAHGVPGAEVSVFVNDGLLLGGETPFTFGTITAEPTTVPAGTYNVKVCAFGTSPGEANCPLIEADVALADGETSTLVANLTATGGLTLSKFGNDLRATYPRGARIGVRHAAAAPAVDVVLSGVNRFEEISVNFGLNNGAGAATEAPAAPVRATINAAGTSGPAVPPSPLDLTLESGKVYYAYAVGSLADGNFTVLLQVLDAEEQNRFNFFQRLRNLRGRF